MISTSVQRPTLAVWLLLDDMRDDASEINLQLGRLMGQVQLLMSTINSMATTIKGLDDRLRVNETNTTILSIKMSLIGIISGAIGSLAISLISKRLTNSL